MHIFMRIIDSEECSVCNSEATEFCIAGLGGCIYSSLRLILLKELFCRIVFLQYERVFCARSQVSHVYGLLRLHSMARP